MAETQSLSTPPSPSKQDKPAAPLVIPEKKVQKEIPVIKMTDFSAVDMDEKLNLLMVAINKVNTNFHMKFEDMSKKLEKVKTSVDSKLQTFQEKLDSVNDVLNDEQDGVLPRLREAEDTITDFHDRIETLEEQHASLQDEIFMLRGIAQVNDRKLISLDDKVLKLTSRSMQNNILIQGLVPQPSVRENCKKLVLDFMKEKMKMEMADSEIIVAHRLGPLGRTSKPRSMVVKCKRSLRSRIFDFTKNLKDLKNENGDFYQVSPQLPEPILTKRRETRETVMEMKKKNDQLADPTKKVNVEFKNGILHLNGKPERKYITPPSVTDVLNLTPDMVKKMDQIHFEQSTTFQEKGNTFTAYALRANTSAEIRAAYRKLKQMIPEADHVMMAYRVKNYSGYHDDREHAAGKKLNSLLAVRNASNVAVFVARVFSGIHIGPKRFLLIEKAAKEALDAL